MTRDVQPEAYDPIESRRQLERAGRALAQGDRVAALGALEEARRLDPHDDEPPLMAAVLSLESGDTARAAELAVQTLGIRPFHPAAWNLLGVACLDAGKSGLARRVLQRAVTLAPGLERARGNLAQARQRKGDTRHRAALPTRAIEALLEESEPTLSVCVVLGDAQEEALEACVESVRPVASEIVVVDQRSTWSDPPRTGGAAVVLLRAASRDSYSSLTEGLRRARHDWVLVLHPWEALAPGTQEALRSALRDEGSLAQLSVLRKPATGGVLKVVRLVRNAPGIRGLGLGADRILPSLLSLETKWGLGTGELGPQIVASGEIGAAAGRNAYRLVEAISDDDPLKPVALVSAAEAELGRDRAERGLDHARHARRLLAAAGPSRRSIEFEGPTVAEGRCLLRLRRFAELSAFMREVHLRVPGTSSTLFLEGAAAAGLKDTARACRLLRDALDIEDRPGFTALPPEARGAGLPNLLGAAELDRGDIGAAGKAFVLALSRDPDNGEARLGRAAVLLAQGQLEPMLHQLDVLISRRGQDPGMWLAGALLLGQVPQLAAPTVGWLEEARVRFPDHLEIRSRLAEAELRRGGAEEAWSGLRALPAAASPSLVATRVAAALACGRELPALPEGDAPALSRLVLGWFERWLTYGAIEALDRALLDITRADRALPGLGLEAATWLERIGQTEAARGVRSRLDA